MRGSTKKTAAALALVAMIALTTACGNNSNGSDNAGVNSGGKTNQTADKGTEAQANEDGALTKYAEPVTLTTAKVLEGDVKFKEGESIDNNVIDKSIESDLNIKMKYLWTASNTQELTEKIRLALSANQELPDMLAISDPLLMSQLVQSGKYQEVTPIFEKYAENNWKQGYESHPEVWNGVTFDDKKYALPMFNMVGRGNVMWIRQDWLDKLNLKAPTNVTELETVMDAFTTQDPDGNGKPDTFGLSVALKDNGVNATWLGSTDFVFAADGVLPNDNGWVKKDDGTIYQPLLTAAAKPGLGKLQEWMKKGYFPKDSGIYDNMKAAELFTSGKAGITFGQYWLSIWPFPDLKKNVPGAEFKAYPYLAGADGAYKVAQENPTNGVNIMIRSGMEHPEAVVKYMNWFFKNYLNPDKGSKYEYGLAEGYDWANVEGQPTNDKSKVPNYLDAVRISVPKDFTLPDAWTEMLHKFTAGEKPSTPMEVKQYGGEDQSSLDAAKILLDGLDKGFQVPQVIGVPVTTTMMSKNAMLDKMRKETISKIIYGEASVDAYDKFLEDYDKAGYGKIMKEVNDWYAKSAK
ncbi:extracellular solute-binding protein [Paenibacillus sp. CF384]|uniref:extracellular solute-binding protein n=1 Tax=Paenibacillus sp. CF384 TaxID=1884382 RepID=UPI00089B9126|nr:extracellular solute-binding protein [Paenibacillus sp. CF384]SDW77174.1 putative aldouronate transport system substrate-binding protein [Paenibacillus sp. CF384]